MANCCPCGDPCGLAADDFDRTTLGDNWDQRSGAWSISGNKLITSDSSGSVIYQAAEAPTASMTVTAVVELNTDGDQVRGIVAWTDDDNYLFGELTRNNCGACTGDCSTLALYQVTGGTATEIRAPIEIGVIDWSGTVKFSVCYYADAYPAGDVGVLSATAAGKTVYKYDVTAGGTFGGLGTGTNSGGATFDDFTLSNSNTFNPSCPECYERCLLVAEFSYTDSTTYNECDFTATGSPTWGLVTGEGNLLQFGAAGCVEAVLSPLDETRAKVEATYHSPVSETVTLTLGEYDLAVTYPASGTFLTVSIDGVTVTDVGFLAGLHTVKMCADGEYLVATLEYSNIGLFTRIIEL